MFDPTSRYARIADATLTVLGDGGRRHTATLRALVDAGAAVDLADRGGTTPLALARARGYGEMAAILQQAGAR